MFKPDAIEAFIGIQHIDKYSAGFVGAFGYFSDQRRIFKNASDEQALSFSQIESHANYNIGVLPKFLSNFGLVHVGSRFEFILGKRGTSSKTGLRLVIISTDPYTSNAHS